MQVRSPLKYIGGKSASAERIVSLFPDPSQYDIYVEACFGAGHVFFAKPQYGHQEIINDKDNNVVTFWLEMQEHAQGLAEVLERLPYARELYYRYYRSLFDGSELSSFERAKRWFYVLRSTGTGWLRKSPVGWNHLHGNMEAYHSALALFEQVQARLQRVTIDNRDVLDTIKRYDSPKTLFYIDPPYFDAEWYYEASKQGFPHEELASRLQHIQGFAVVSYYPHEKLESLYPQWRRIIWQQTKNCSIQLEKLTIATEMVLVNYPEPQENLWDGMLA